MADVVWSSGQFGGNTIVFTSTGRFTGEDDEPTAGVREPRRPKPNRPQGAMEIEHDTDLDAMAT